MADSNDDLLREGECPNPYCVEEAGHSGPHFPGSRMPDRLEQVLAELEAGLDLIDAERERAEQVKQERDNWKAGYEALVAVPQLKLLISKLEQAEADLWRAEAQVEKLTNPVRMLVALIKDEAISYYDLCNDGGLKEETVEAMKELRAVLAASEKMFDA